MALPFRGQTPAVTISYGNYKYSSTAGVNLVSAEPVILKSLVFGGLGTAGAVIVYDWNLAATASFSGTTGGNIILQIPVPSGNMRLDFDLATNRGLAISAAAATQYCVTYGT